MKKLVLFSQINNHFISSFLCVAPYLSLTLSRTHTLYLMYLTSHFDINLFLNRGESLPYCFHRLFRSCKPNKTLLADVHLYFFSSFIPMKECQGEEMGIASKSTISDKYPVMYMFHLSWCRMVQKLDVRSGRARDLCGCLAFHLWESKALIHSLFLCPQCPTSCSVVCL